MEANNSKLITEEKQLPKEFEEARLAGETLDNLPEPTDEHLFEELLDVESKSPIEKAQAMLYAIYDFRKNIVLEKIEMSAKGENKYKKMTEWDYNSIYCKLQKSACKISKDTLRSILNSDFVRMYDPFKEYFTKLPAWDGTTDHILELASTVKTTKDDFWHDCFKKWIVAFVATAVSEKITNHSVIVFAGKQGLGKTTWHLNLVPPALSEYKFSGTIKPSNKDSAIHLSECLLINLDELESLNMMPPIVRADNRLI